MRVTGGEFKGRPLKTTPGLAARPTTDKVRQSIFNILMNDIEGTTVLDLFAGSGALGIEALSRGAKEAVFIEQGHAQAEAIKQNLVSLDLPKNIIKADYKGGCRKLAEEGKQFDIVFADPPYEKVPPDDVAKAVMQYNLLRIGGFLILEHKTGGEVKSDCFILLKRKKYGQTEVTFYVRER